MISIFTQPCVGFYQSRLLRKQRRSRATPVLLYMSDIYRRHWRVCSPWQSFHPSLPRWMNCRESCWWSAHVFTSQWRLVRCISCDICINVVSSMGGFCDGSHVVNFLFWPILGSVVLGQRVFRKVHTKQLSARSFGGAAAVLCDCRRLYCWGWSTT